MQKILIAIFVMTLVGILAGGTCIAAVPGSISYQGKLTDTLGIPVPDGSYSLVFRLYNAAADGTKIWESAVTPVTTSGGLFITSLAMSSSSLISANLWLEMQLDSTPLLPRVKLASVPYALRAGVADIPDGSIGKAKLGPDVVFMRAPYLQGVTSRAIYRLIITIDGQPTDYSATLAAPFSISIPVSADTLATKWQTWRLGVSKLGNIVLRRKLTDNLDWYNLVINRIEAGTKLEKVHLRVETLEGLKVAEWIWSNCAPIRYNMRLVDDGLPVEEMTLTPTLMTRTLTNLVNDVPPLGSGVQTGLSSGQYFVPTYRVRIAGSSPLLGIVVASDVAFYHGMSAGIHPSKVGIMESFKLRQNPGATGGLYEWFASVAGGQTNLLKPVELQIWGEEFRTSLRHESAIPYTYTLRLADDGMPIEEFDLISLSPTRN